MIPERHGREDWKAALLVLGILLVIWVIMLIARLLHGGLW